MRYRLLSITRPEGDRAFVMIDEQLAHHVDLYTLMGPMLTRMGEYNEEVLGGQSHVINLAEQSYRELSLYHPHAALAVLGWAWTAHDRDHVHEPVDFDMLLVRVFETFGVVSDISRAEYSQTKQIYERVKLK